jgi:hypothetical protein
MVLKEAAVVRRDIAKGDADDDVVADNSDDASDRRKCY